MDKIKEFYQSFGFVVLFMLMVIIISATMGQKFLSRFLMLVLTSQIIFNADTFIGLLNKFQSTTKTINSGTDNKDTKKSELGDFNLKT